MMRSAVPPTVSQHLRFICGLSTIFVVYIHSTTIKYDPAASWNWPVGRAEGLLSHELFHVALPVFFLTSAFFLHLGRPHLRDIWPAVVARGPTLLVPYLLWALLAGITLTAVRRFGFELPDRADRGDLWHQLLAPAPGQFWYLRDVIALVLASPLLVFVSRPLLWIMTVAAGLWWLWDETPTVLVLRTESFHIVSNEAIFWFLTGILAARGAGRFCAALQRGLHPASLGLLAFLWVALALTPMPGELSHGLSVIAGTALLLLCAPSTAGFASALSVPVFASYGFLIYVTHYPLIAIVQVGAIRLLPEGPTTHVLVYLATPPIVIAAIVLAASSLSKQLPKIAALLNGQRALIPLSRHKADRAEIAEGS